jgi:TRAP-type uncharacterized transport system fused permease subunit
MNFRRDESLLSRLSLLVLILALVCTLEGSAAFAHSVANPANKSGETENRTEQRASTGREPTDNEKLKASVTNLVEDAKAGKLKLPTPQTHSRNSNNLSKGAKIGIGVGIAVAIIGIIVWRNSWH